MTTTPDYGARAVEAGFAQPYSLAIMAAASLLHTEELRRVVTFLSAQLQVADGSMTPDEARWALGTAFSVRTHETWLDRHAPVRVHAINGGVTHISLGALNHADVRVVEPEDPQ